MRVAKATADDISSKSTGRREVFAYATYKSGPWPKAWPHALPALHTSVAGQPAQSPLGLFLLRRAHEEPAGRLGHDYPARRVGHVDWPHRMSLNALSISELARRCAD